MSDSGKTFSELRTLLRGRVLALCAVLLLSFVGTGILFPIMPLYLKTLGATGTVVGLVMAVAGLGEGIFGFVWGSLADRIGIAIPLAAQMFGGVVCLVAFAFIPVLGAVFVLRFILAGLGSAIWPTGRGYLAHSVPPRSKGLAMAIFALLVTGGMNLGAFLSGVLVDQWGFPVTFLTAAALLVVAGIIVVTQLRGARIVHGETASAVEPATSEPMAASDHRTSVGPILILSLIVMLIAVVFGSVSTFIPLLMTEISGLAATDVGVVFGVAGMVTLVLLIPMGQLSDRGGRKLTMVGGLGLLLLAVLGLAYARSFWPIMLFAVFNSVGRWATDPPILALLSDITPLRYQGRTQGIYVVAVDLGIIVGPVAVGILWDRVGPQPAFLLCAVVAIIALAVTFFMVKEKEWLALPMESIAPPA